MTRSRIFVSPNVGQDLPIEKSVKSLTGGEQARFRSLATDLLGSRGSTHNSVGAWVDGSEPVVSALANVDPATARKLAGHLGKAAHQKAVLVFHEHEDGPQVIHDVQVHGTDIPSIHKSLLAHGIKNHTITPGQHSTTVSVYDQDGSQTQPVATFTRAAHGHHTQTKGTGEFLGDPNWASRAKAKAEYAKLSRVKKALGRIRKSYLYHGSNEDHLSDITREGLKAMAPDGRWNNDGEEAWYDGSTDPRVFFGPKPEEIETHFRRGYQGGRPLLFRVPANHKNIHGSNAWESWSNSNIPPQDLEYTTDHPRTLSDKTIWTKLGDSSPLHKARPPEILPARPIQKEAFDLSISGHGYGRPTDPKGHPEIWKAANSYAQGKGLTLSPLSYQNVNQALGRKIGAHYDKAPHAPHDPEVAKSYHAFKQETKAQLQHLQGLGYKFTPWPHQGQDAYQGGSHPTINDIRNNKHLYFFTGGDLPHDHPLAESTGINLNGHDLNYNEAFRAVHDVFGHALYGNGFGPTGEDHAFRSHSQMYSPEARPAMANETKGQNSWVHYGPHSHLTPAQRPYAEQKANLLKLARRVVRKARFQTPEEREHEEAETALSSGQEPSAALIGQLKPGTKKQIGGKSYLRSMDGPYELTSVDPKSFGYRPQKFRNQKIIDKYRDQIRNALAAGKSPAEAIEPVQGEPFQREDINEGRPTNYLRDGNHRTDAAIAEGLDQILAWFPMRKGRLRELLTRLRLRRSLPSRPIHKGRTKSDQYHYISVPEPLTTAQHQHWLDYNLLPHEAKAVQRSRTFGRDLEKIAPMSGVLQSTISGRHGRHWYDENHDILRAATHHSSDPRDFARLAALEAGTSPNNGIMPNQQAAYDIFRLWHTGASIGNRHIPGRSENPQDITDLVKGYGQGEMNYPPDYPDPVLRGQPLMKRGKHPRPTKQNKGVLKMIHTPEGWQPVPIHYPSHRGLAVKALSDPDKYGDPNRVGGFTTHPVKADSFLRNKLGNQHPVTIDRHEARGYGIEIGEEQPDGSTQTLPPALYHFLVGAGRHSARLLNHPDYNPLSSHPIYGKGWTGARGQAARWMTMRGIRDAIAKGATPEEAALNLKAKDIYNISAFAPMFDDPEYLPRIRAMMAEGSLPPDFLHRVSKIQETYRPSDKELEETVGHPDLVPIARNIARVLDRQKTATMLTGKGIKKKPKKKKGKK